MRLRWLRRNAVPVQGGIQHSTDFAEIQLFAPIPRGKGNRGRVASLEEYGGSANVVKAASVAR
jgi:hypothetical protein